MTLAELHSAAVDQVLQAAPGPCALCGVPLHAVADLRTDLFEVADAAGSKTGRDPDLAHLYDPAANPLGATSPYDALNKMAALMDTAHRAVQHGRAEYTPLHWRIAGEYSMLRVRLSMGLSFHVHRVVASSDPARLPGLPRPADLPPWHCGWPAWLRPSGWHCRQCRIVLDDQIAELPEAA
jgi:hypothetical protein